MKSVNAKWSNRIYKMNETKVNYLYEKRENTISILIEILLVKGFDGLFVKVPLIEFEAS